MRRARAGSAACDGFFLPFILHLHPSSFVRSERAGLAACAGFFLPFILHLHPSSFVRSARGIGGVRRFLSSLHPSPSSFILCSLGARDWRRAPVSFFPSSFTFVLHPLFAGSARDRRRATVSLFPSSFTFILHPSSRSRLLLLSGSVCGVRCALWGRGGGVVWELRGGDAGAGGRRGVRAVWRAAGRSGCPLPLLPRARIAAVSGGAPPGDARRAASAIDP